MTTQFPDDGYRRALQLSGLLSKEQLARALQDCQSQTRPLPEFLVHARLLTPWQNQKLLEGRHRGFFLGKHKLLAHIGTSGLGSVYLSEHFGRRLAVQVLPQALTENAAALAQFYRRSQAVAGLAHPNLVGVFDVDNAGAIHFLVMEYVEGRDLGGFVAAHGPLPAPEAAEAVRQAAAALACAHERNLVHHNLQPANLLRTPSGVIKVLNLGFAEFSADAPSFRGMPRVSWLSWPGRLDDATLGQRGDARPCDPQPDIAGLGSTLYFLLFGEAPLAGTLSPGLLPAGDPLTAAGPGSPRELAEICRRMLGQNPGGRYQSCEEVEQALAGWLQSRRRD